MPVMRVNVARVWEDADYVKVRNMCDNHQGWHEVSAHLVIQEENWSYSKNMYVHVKPSAASEQKVFHKSESVIC